MLRFKGRTHQVFYWDLDYRSDSFEIWRLHRNENKTRVVVEGSRKGPWQVAVDLNDQDSTLIKKHMTTFAIKHRTLVDALEHGELVYAGFWGDCDLQREIEISFGMHDQKDPE